MTIDDKLEGGRVGGEIRDSEPPKIARGRNGGRKKGSKGVFSHNAIAKIVAQKLQGRTGVEIARDVGTTPTAISTLLAEFKPLTNYLSTIDTFRVNQLDLLDAARAKLLSLMFHDNALKKSNAGHLAYAFRQLYDCGRLERGKSTANVAVALSEAFTSYKSE